MSRRACATPRACDPALVLQVWRRQRPNQAALRSGHDCRVADETAETAERPRSELIETRRRGRERSCQPGRAAGLEAGHAHGRDASSAASGSSFG